LVNEELGLAAYLSAMTVAHGSLGMYEDKIKKLGPDPLRCALSASPAAGVMQQPAGGDVSVICTVSTILLWYGFARLVLQGNLRNYHANHPALP
jgi:hypothetical protein